MNKLRQFLLRNFSPAINNNKYNEELKFWSNEIQNFIRWYSGEIKEHYGCKCPSEEQKIKAANQKDSAILTWFDLHQKPKYLYDLELDRYAFSGDTVLDIGAGPIPSALAFKDCLVYCLDPLYHKYLEAGFPMHYYDNVKFIHGYSENIPVADKFFDAVISVNAIDHVDDLAKTSGEIRRVIKEGGKFGMHVHYHKKTVTEPIEINDAVFWDIFGWCKGLKKVKESGEKMGYVLAADDGSYALWKNF
jgi:SAM-dependent methyltransferase